MKYPKVILVKKFIIPGGYFCDAYCRCDSEEAENRIVADYNEWNAQSMREHEELMSHSGE